MTQRKPKAMSFPTWVDQQIADAQARGVFDDLPGAGQPLDLSGDADFTGEWLRDYIRREGASFEDALPLPLRLRKESERLTETIAQFPGEAAVRAAASDLNRRILDWRRIPVGPPVYVKLADEEALAAAWRASRAEAEEAARARRRDAAAAAVAPRPARRRLPGRRAR